MVAPVRQVAELRFAAWGFLQVGGRDIHCFSIFPKHRDSVISNSCDVNDAFGCVNFGFAVAVLDFGRTQDFRLVNELTASGRRTSGWREELL